MGLRRQLETADIWHWRTKEVNKWVSETNKGSNAGTVCFLHVFYKFSTGFLRPPSFSPLAVVIRRARLEQLPRS